MTAESSRSNKSVNSVQVEQHLIKSAATNRHSVALGHSFIWLVVIIPSPTVTQVSAQWINTRRVYSLAVVSAVQEKLFKKSSSGSRENKLSRQVLSQIVSQFVLHCTGTCVCWPTIIPCSLPALKPNLKLVPKLNSHWTWHARSFVCVYKLLWRKTQSPANHLSGAHDGRLTPPCLAPKIKTFLIRAQHVVTTSCWVQ